VIQASGPKPPMEVADDQAHQPGPCGYPARVLDIRNWKLTLPTAIKKHTPAEIQPADLQHYVNRPWFDVATGCSGLVFRAPVNGATTSGSSYPRSELREMTPDGQLASWSSTSGTHTLVVNEAFTALPSGKPELVGAQIHDDEDDITVFRLEGSKLYVTNGNEPHYQLVTDDYRLGTRYQAKYVVGNGQVQAFYNGKPVATIKRDFSNAYFKVGAYTQANCDKVDACGLDNYGETTVYGISVTHS